MLLPSKLVVTKQYREHLFRWMAWLKTEQGVAIIFPHLSDRFVRMRQVMAELEKTEWAQVVMYDPFLMDCENLQEFHQNLNYLVTGEIDKDFIAALPEGKKLVLVMMNGDNLLLPQNVKVLHYLQHLGTQESGKIAYISGFEKDAYKLASSFFDHNLLFQNIEYYPLYDTDDTKIFLQYLAADWKIELSEQIERSLLQEVGGSFWLAKQAMRVLRDEKTWSNEHPTHIERVQNILDCLSSEELKIIALSPKIEQLDSKVINHLMKTGLLDKDYIVTIPRLKIMAEKRLKNEVELKLANESIYLNGVDISSILSTNEYLLLKSMMKDCGTPFSREKIGEILWGNNDQKYSPWAIDQAFKRLRDKLVKLGLPGSIIHAVRGIGYEYRT